MERQINTSKNYTKTRQELQKVSSRDFPKLQSGILDQNITVSVSFFIFKTIRLYKNKHAKRFRQLTSIIVINESESSRAPTEAASTVRVNLEAKSSFDNVSTWINNICQCQRKWASAYWIDCRNWSNFPQINCGLVVLKSRLKILSNLVVPTNIKE